MTWTLYEGDCLEVMRGLPSESVDAVVTDPPYSSGGNTDSQRRRTAGAAKYTHSSTQKKLRDAGKINEWFGCDNMGTVGFEWLLRSVLLECFRVLKPNATACVFIDWRMFPVLAGVFESAGFRWNNVVVWDKKAPGLGTGFRPRHEFILVGSKGVPEYYDKTVGNVIAASRPTGKEHPTEKPVGLLSRLVGCVAAPGGTVLDPFAGSGSTLEACYTLGRNSIGIEREPAYCDIIRRRMAALGEPLPLEVAQ